MGRSKAEKANEAMATANTNATKEEAKQPVKKKGVRLYYSPVAKQTVVIYLLDENGKRIPQLDPKGNDRYIGNEPLHRSKTITFNCMVNDPSKGCLSYYETKEPKEIAALDKLVKDQSTQVIDEDGYQKSKNKTAWEKTVEITKKDQVIEEQQNTIDSLNAQLAAALKKTSGSEKA